MIKRLLTKRAISAVLVLGVTLTGVAISPEAQEAIATAVVLVLGGGHVRQPTDPL